MKSFFRAASKLFALLAVGGVAYYIHEFASAERRIKEVCSQIKPGMSMLQLQTFGVEQGLTRPHTESGINYMVERRTYGRYGCKLLLEAGVVKEAEYNFAD